LVFAFSKSFLIFSIDDLDSFNDALDVGLFAVEMVGFEDFGVEDSDSFAFWELFVIKEDHVQGDVKQQKRYRVDHKFVDSGKVLTPFLNELFYCHLADVSLHIIVIGPDRLDKLLIFGECSDTRLVGMLYFLYIGFLLFGILKINAVFVGLAVVLMIDVGLDMGVPEGFDPFVPSVPVPVLDSFRVLVDQFQVVVFLSVQQA
jgi:hypothetical protein